MARKSVLPEKIISILEKNHLLTVSEMVQLFKSNGENFNKTSVYRALEKMLKHGEVCKQNFSESEAVFELRNNHHDHAVCTNCEKVITVECKSNLVKNIPGFKVDHHHTTLYGLCENCTN